LKTAEVPARHRLWRREQGRHFGVRLLPVHHPKQLHLGPLPRRNPDLGHVVGGQRDYRQRHHRLRPRIYQSAASASNSRIEQNKSYSNTTADYDLAAGTWVGAGNPNTLTARTAALTLTPADNGRAFTNEGATARVDFALPTAIAGYSFTFLVQDADGLRITAAAGDTVRIAASVSAAAGYAESTATGSVLTLTAINAALRD